jgi:hypothetical protein
MSTKKDEAFLSFTKSNESGKKSKLAQEYIEKNKNKPPNKPRPEFNIEEFIMSQKPHNSSTEQLEKERNYLKNVRNSVIPSEYFKIENSLKFFEQNTIYFVTHPFEFQRLIGQLNTNERQIFLHSIYTYYYADVLIAMKQMRSEPKIPLKDFTNDVIAVDSVYLEYIRSDPDLKTTNFDVKKVKQVYRCIRENMVELQTEQTNAFYNLLLKLNSEEIYMLEELMGQNPTL